MLKYYIGDFMYEEHLTRLNYNGKEILLLGTAHVSSESAKEVEEVIEAEKPDSICIELDAERYNSMKNQKKWEDTDLVEVIRKKQAFLLLANLILASYQKRMAGKLGSEVGREMSTAMALAEEKNIPLVLADRSVQTTFKRIWAKHSLQEKVKILTALLSTEEAEEEITAEDIEKLKNTDELEAALSEVAKEFPTVYRVLVEERNQLLAYNIKNAPGHKVLAVLGAAHVPGISEEIFTDRDVSELDKLPSQSKRDKWKKWILPLLITLLILFSFIRNIDSGIASVKSWIIVKGCFAAFGTAICLAHPLSVVVSFITAPFTAFSPFLAAGFFAGISEAHFHKPKVADFNTLSDDVSSLKGIVRNRVSRVLLVVIVTNVFSAIGTFVAGLDLIRNLF